MGPDLAQPLQTGSLKWESEILSKKEKAEKWLFSFWHPKWIPLLSHNNFLKIPSSATLGSQLHHLSLSSQAPHSSRCFTVQPGNEAAWEWGYVICYSWPTNSSSVTPGPGSFGCTSNQPSFKNFPGTSSLSWQNLYQGLVLTFTLVQNFCFYKVLFCPVSHLVLMITWWSNRDGIFTPILQGRRLRLSSGISSVVRN